MTFSRRNFFALTAGALLAQDKTGMNVLSRRPEDLEMPLSGFSDYITPIEHFFVRTHVYVPTVDLAAWRLVVDGEVATPLTLTMDELKSADPKHPAVNAYLKIQSQLKAPFAQEDPASKKLVESLQVEGYRTLATNGVVVGPDSAHPQARKRLRCTPAAPR